MTVYCVIVVTLRSCSKLVQGSVSYQAVGTQCGSVWIWAVGLRLGQHDWFGHDGGHLTPLVGRTGSKLLYRRDHVFMPGSCIMKLLF